MQGEYIDISDGLLKTDVEEKGFTNKGSI